MMSKSILVFLVVLLSVNSRAIFSQEATPNKVHVELSPVTAYDDMPAGYRKAVSREQYSKMLDAMPTADEVAEEVEASKRVEHRLIGTSIRNIDQSVKIFELIASNKDFASALNVVPDQLEEFGKLRAEYEARKRKLKSGNSTKKSIADLDHQFAKKMAEILLPFQLAEIGRMRASYAGVPKVLTESKIGDAIGLTEKQKLQIRKKCQQLADEIEEFVAEKRKEAAELNYQVLSTKQREKLLGLIPANELDGANNVPIELLWNFLDYSNGETYSKTGLPMKKVLTIWRTK